MENPQQSDYGGEGLKINFGEPMTLIGNGFELDVETP